MRRPALLAFAVVSVAALVPVTATSASAAADEGVTTTVYLLAAQPDPGPFLIPVQRSVPAGVDLPRAAVVALLAGPTTAETQMRPALSTAVPAGVELLDLVIADGVATINLDGTFDDGGGSASMFGRLGQVVFTLTRFRGIDAVALELDGHAVEVFSGEGLVLEGPIGRGWFTEQDSGIVPPVLLDTPAWGAALTHVAGMVRNPSEPVALSIWDTDGVELGAAMLVPDADGRFMSWLPFDLPTSGLAAVIVVSGDGTGLREHLVELEPAVVRGLARACPTLVDVPFGDVPTNGVHAEAIACAAQWRMMVGRPDGTFAPAQVVTRAQVASVVARLLEAVGVELPAAPALPFVDVQPDAPHALRIAQLAQLGVVNGVTADRFGPAEPVMRDHVAAILSRALGLLEGAVLLPSEERFADSPSSPHAAAIDSLAQLRLVAGTGPIYFGSRSTLTRGQLAALVARTADLLAASGHVVAPVNAFDVHAVEVGDVVAGLPIVALEVSAPDAAYLTAHVEFGGELTLAGTVTAHDDHEQLGDAVCMTNIDPASQRLLPRMLQDTRYPWFCFTNSDVARAEAFAPGETTATIVIDRYAIHYAPTEMWDTARLLRVEQPGA